MKIGFNLLLWTTHVTDEHLHTLDILKEVGYDGVEIPIFEGDTPHFTKVGKAIANAGLGCTAVTVIPDAEHSPVSPDAAARAGAVEHLQWAIDCAAAVGAETLCGPYHQPLGIFTGDGPTEDEKNRAAEVHRQAAEYAQKNNVLLAIEYLNRFECYFLTTMADAADHVRRVGHPNFSTMFDTFHANIEEKDPAAALADNIDVVKHIHISENDRGTPGTGNIDWNAIFKAIKETNYDRWLTIEAFGRALPDLAAATRVWRDFFADPKDVYTDGFKFIKSMTG